MLGQYKCLPSRCLTPGISFHQPASSVPRNVKLDFPADEVMTDLMQVEAVTVEPGASIDAANLRMIKRGIRMLFVVDARQTVLGLISAGDILGEKPIQFIQKHGGDHSSVTVEDIMTACADLQVFSLESVKTAKVGNVVAALQKHTRQHALVVDKQGGILRIRGIFSSTQIARLLGIEIPMFGAAARTLLDLKAKLLE